MSALHIADVLPIHAVNLPESSPAHPERGETDCAPRPPFNDVDADLVLCSSDGVRFCVYKVLLAKASPVIREILLHDGHEAYILPDGRKVIRGASDAGLPMLTLPHGSEELDDLLSFLYPVSYTPPSTLLAVARVLAVISLYDMESTIESFQSYWIGLLDDAAANKDPAALFEAYALACDLGLREEAELAAEWTVQYPMILKDSIRPLRHASGRAISDLWVYRKKCMAAIRFNLSQLGGAPDNNELWLGGWAACNKSRKSLAPKWVGRMMDNMILRDDESLAFRAAAFRDKFLSKLRAHARRDNCVFCLACSTETIFRACDGLIERVSSAVSEV